MSSFAEAETFVIWDMEDCKIPIDLDTQSVYKNIKSALANEGYHGNLSIEAYYSNENQIGNDLIPEGITLIQDRLIAQRFHQIISEIGLCGATNPHQLWNFLLIADNVEYVKELKFVKDLEGLTVNILLADNVNPSSVVRKLKPSSVWLWKSLSSGGNPIDLSARLTKSIRNEIVVKRLPEKSVVRFHCGSKKSSVARFHCASIPNELILEILSRLPAKSVTRFHCLSKLWASKLCRPDFTELFLTRSSARPRLLFALEEEGVWSFFSSPQNQNSSSSLTVTAEFHVKFPPDNMRIYSRRHRQLSCGYASGLIYFYCMWNEKEKNAMPVICNPNTGQYATLPYLQRYRKCYSFFGFDPVDKQYKVLFIADPCSPDDHKILTFGTGKMRWRKINCSLKHEIESEGICINGVLYYLGDRKGWAEFETPDNYVIVCFDLRSEKFNFIYLESFCVLINYKGKLGVIFNDPCDDHEAIELRVWVLEDVGKEEWSKYAYTLRYDRFFRHKAFVVGVTPTGEIILSMNEYISEEPFYVYYFNPERNTVQRVEIQGFGKYHKKFSNHVYTFADHVEDLNVIDAKLLSSSICAPYVKTEEEQENEKKKKKRKKNENQMKKERKKKKKQKTK